ncbi:UNVERIFIED_CONTAM: hypothetical protein K2H54_059194 [Gekko kuhli]
MRLKELLLLLLLLAVMAAELKVQNAPGTGTQALWRSKPKVAYGMKLCGCEFICAIIFICGGSQWKRLSGDCRVEEEPLLDGGLSVDAPEDSKDECVNLELRDLGEQDHSTPAQQGPSDPPAEEDGRPTQPDSNPETRAKLVPARLPEIAATPESMALEQVAPAAEL